MAAAQSRRFTLSNCSCTSSKFSCDTRLLHPQPSGFEGFAAVRQQFTPAKLGPAKRFHGPPATLNDGLASVWAATLKDPDDNFVTAGIDDLRGLNREPFE